MKSTVVVVTFILFLLMSYSAKAEDHAGDGSGGRAGVTALPQVDVQGRLNELTSACFAGRPFPARQAQIPVQPPVTQPPGDSAPTITVPPPTQPDNKPPTPDKPVANTAGRDLIGGKCITCHHHAGSTPDSFKGKASEVERRLNLPLGAPGHMPDQGSISESEKAAIISWVKGQ